ncbi:hypothetical protein [Nocardia sp. NBC_01327]|uniref:hypothetical protein n=1 Tax=Nocardia sp. NBC_01327 TaxID=2903593 RepID=UPI002E0E162E|nr:hypothetical protein OG326_29300 [Nocardia sp. NBC_01327]
MWAVEHDQVALEKHSVIDKLAGLLEIDVGWLLGQPYQPAAAAQDGGHHAVPALRSALQRTSLILSGYPAIRAATEPQSLPILRAEVDRVVRMRQAASLPEVMLALPNLVAELNIRALGAAGANELDVIGRLIVETSQVARMVLNKLGYHDLAWTAVEIAAAAAARSGDPLMLACAAWERCGVLLHTGSPAQVLVVAEAAMDDLADQMGTHSAEVLSLYGALGLRCAVAAARHNDSASAWQYLREAERTAARIGLDRNDFQTVFGPGNVAIHATEIAVELDQPELALRHHTSVALESVPSRERHIRHGIDVARAYGQLGDDTTAVRTLRTAAGTAPHYVYNHPLARGLVENLLRRAQPSAFDAGLAGVADAMCLGI